jgi:thioredoxin reductase
MTKEVDIVVVGAGPVGLFTVFEATENNGIKSQRSFSTG